jgi:integrase
VSTLAHQLVTRLPQLTDREVDGFVFLSKPYRKYDELGLYLLIKNGRKIWRHEAEVEGKLKTIDLGDYPALSLAQAREKRNERREAFKNGVDPKILANRRKALQTAKLPFETYAERWLEVAAAERNWKLKTLDTARQRLRDYVYPEIGSIAVASVLGPDLALVRDRVMREGTIPTGKKVRQLVLDILDGARSDGLGVKDHRAQLDQWFKGHKPHHHASFVEEERIGELLLDLDQYHGTRVVQLCLRLAPHVFVRPGELIEMEWEEVHLDGEHPHWMKGRNKKNRDHITPLTPQSLAILRALHALTGNRRWVFPSQSVRKRGNGPSAERHLSNGTINKALQSLGWDTQKDFTGHGFRTMARSILDEQMVTQGWEVSAVRIQLQHVSENSMDRIYMRAKHIHQRRAICLWWSSFLDRVRQRAAAERVRQQALEATAAPPP